MYASYTRFRVKKWWAVPFFQVHAMRSVRQAKSSIGMLKMETIYAGGMDFCTLTTWESKEDMLKFRNSGAHLIAMKLSGKMGQGYALGLDCDEIPNGKEGAIRLEEKMRLIGNEEWISLA